MSIKFQFDPSQNLVRITIKGTFSLEDFKTTMEQLTGSKEYAPDINALWDLRELDFSSINEAYWRQILEIRKKHPKRNKACLAHVVRGDFAFGMMRMYQILSSHQSDELHQQVMVFRSMEDAEQWLKG